MTPDQLLGDPDEDDEMPDSDGKGGNPSPGHEHD